MRAGLDASTVTPGRTAPVVSFTVPAMPPVVCAPAEAGSRTARSANLTSIRVVKTLPPLKTFDGRTRAGVRIVADYVASGWRRLLQYVAAGGWHASPPLDLC